MMIMMMCIDSHYAMVQNDGANDVANREARDENNDRIDAPNDGSNDTGGKRDSKNGSYRMTASLAQSTTWFFVFILMTLIRF